MEGAAIMFGQQAAHRGLARSHQSDEKEIVSFAHGAILIESCNMNSLERYLPNK
jgi:hypothetical protein